MGARARGTADRAAHDSDARGIRHFRQTFSVRRHYGPREVTDWLRLSAGHLGRYATHALSPCSCAGFRRAVELLDHRLTHRELLDLAGYGGRELLHEPDVARDLVVPDTILTALADTPLVE